MIECLKMHKENFDYCLGELIRESEEKDKEIERLNNIIKEVRKAVETGISEDNYDGCVYDIKNILDEGER